MAAKKEVVRFGPFKDFIADGVRHGDTVYLSGQVSTDAEGNIVGEGDAGAQVKQAYENIKEILGHFGATMDNVVDEMWLVTDIGSVMGNVGELYAVRSAAYGGTPECTQTLVQVGALVMPELLIEIKCIAHL